MTSTALEHTPTALAIRAGQDMFDAKQRAALEVLGVRGASNAELAVFMHYCQKTQLDPFSRQVYYINRGGRWVIQTGIGGFQVIRDRVAQRTHVSVEYDDTVWFDQHGGEHAVWLKSEPPAAAKVVVLKDGRRFPAVVLYAEVAALKDGKPQSEWAHQPARMLEKCAEAAALRRAFPHDLAGLYIDDEMPPATIKVEAERVDNSPVTAADIIGGASPATQEQTSPADGRPPVAGSSAAPTANAPASPAPTAAAKRAETRARHATANLQQLVAQVLGTWPEHDVIALYERVIGEPLGDNDITVKQAELIASTLADALEAAKGDGEVASSSLWRQFHPDGE